MKRTGKSKTPQSSISAETAGRLSTALERLAISPRLEFVKALQCGLLLGPAGERIPPLKGVTIRDLVSMGPKKILKLRGLNDAALTLLCSILENLAGDASPFLDEPSGSDIEPLRLASHHELAAQLSPLSGKGSPDLANIPQHSSSEAELRLINVLEQIRKSPAAEKVYSLKVSELWEEQWPRAPFEEAMTIRQVLQMDVENLLRKRSFTGRKLLLFIQAMEKVVARLPDERSISAAPSRASNDAETAAFIPTWDLRAASASALEKAALLEFEREARGSSPIAPLLRAIVSAMSANEWLMLWRASEEEKDIEPSLSQKFLEAARRGSPSIVAAWEAALAGAGVGYEQLTRPFSSSLVVEDGVFKALLLALGAKHPVIRGKILNTLWTKTPALTELALANLPKGISIEELRRLFPSFPPGVCEDICKIVS